MQEWNPVIHVGPKSPNSTISQERCCLKIRLNYIQWKPGNVFYVRRLFLVNMRMSGRIFFDAILPTSNTFKILVFLASLIHREGNVSSN